MSVIVDAVTQRGWHIVSGAHRRPLTWRPFAFVVGEAAFPLPDGFEAWAVEAGAWLTYEGDQERVCGGPLSITTGTLSQGGTCFFADDAGAWNDLPAHHPFAGAFEHFTRSRRFYQWHVRRGVIDLAQPRIMGIWNVAQSSFSSVCEQGLAATAEHAQCLVEEGADMLDIGAEPTGPYAPAITQHQEQAHLESALTWAKCTDLPISVDTYRIETMRWAAASGLADVINDIGRDSVDPDCAGAVFSCLRDSGMGYIMMAYAPHAAPTVSFELCMAQILAQLSAKLDLAFDAGLDLARVVVDPGIGFGKGVADNDPRLITQAVPAMRCLARPVLIAPSRKRCLGVLTNRSIDDRDVATAIASALAFQSGAAIVRVHRPKYVTDARALATVQRD